MGAKDDNWKDVQSRGGSNGARGKKVVLCPKGCGGHCPFARAQRGWDGTEALAVCLKPSCDGKYMPHKGKVVVLPPLGDGQEKPKDNKAEVTPRGPDGAGLRKKTPGKNQKPTTSTGRSSKKRQK